MNPEMGVLLQSVPPGNSMDMGQGTESPKGTGLPRYNLRISGENKTRITNSILHIDRTLKALWF